MAIKENERIRKEYTGRINKAIDFIENHIHDELNLKLVAKAANFSPYHFHRIFSTYTGETLYSFIKRLRLEKAASFLLDNRYLPVTEIAEKCGFSSLPIFSRAFKEYFGMSATEFRNGGYQKYSKKSKLYSKNGKPGFIDPHYIGIEKPTHFKSLPVKVKIMEMSEMTVAYCRHTGKYNEVSKAYEKLFKWAVPRDLYHPLHTRVITLYHDDPKITDEEKIRQSVCITIDKNVKTEGEIGKMKIKGGKYALFRFEVFMEEFHDAWNTVMVDWLPESGYQCDDRYPYEMYYRSPKEHPEGKFEFDICLPVKAL
jgi:AraC family transcriptional regulator